MRGLVPFTQKDFFDFAATAVQNHGLESGSRKRKTIVMSRNSTNLVESRGIDHRKHILYLHNVLHPMDLIYLSTDRSI